MTFKNLSAPWLTRLNWDEITALIICLTLDIIEYPLPQLMAPYSGDVLDLLGTVISVYLFGIPGFLSLFELVPGLDILPIFTLTWVLWYSLKRRKAQKEIEQKLDEWK